jgi:iron complex outermembrane receptor protein
MQLTRSFMHEMRTVLNQRGVVMTGRRVGAKAVAALGVVALFAGGAPAIAQDTGASADEETVVVGRARQLYRVDSVQAGRLPTEPLASSLTVQVIDADLIRDQGARDAQDLYRNLSGVSFFSYGGVTARGFRQEEIFFDSLRGDPYAGFSVPVLFNVEQVEFLKGPAGMLYGPGAPGGVFNYVTKRPDEAFSAKAAGVVGTEARHGASFELTGRLPGLGAPAGRLGVFYEDRNAPRRNADNASLILDAGLAFDLGGALLTLQASRYEQDLAANRLRGVPTDNAGRFLTDRRWNHNEPTDFLRLEANVAQARLEWPVSDDLSLDAALRFSESVESQQYHEPFGLFDSDLDGRLDSTRRQYRDQIRDGQYLSFGANAIWSAQIGPLQNRVLAGIDAFEGDLVFDGRSVNGTNVSGRGRPTPLSLFTPAYGVTNPAAYTLPGFTRSITEQTRAGAYLLNEPTLGRLIGTLGVRFDRFEDTSGAIRFEDDRATWRGGLVYRVRDDVSFYAQWADSFEPQGVASQDVRAGGPFEPTEGVILEGGVRTALFDGRLQSTIAFYEIVRTNILQADPRGDVGNDGVNDFVAFGEVTSEGAELDVAADLTDDWVLTASYAYNDTRITATNGRTAITNSVGDRFANAPEHALGFWTRYQIRALNLAVALGGDFIDVRTSLSGQKVRPYQVFDASLIYEAKGWRALLRVDNLADETYAASGFIDRTGHFPGEPRSVFFEVSREW